jgi:dephospho-CoA kinase
MIYGLTGGIGSGKSYVGDILREHGIAVIDVDKLSHMVTAPGEPLVSVLAAEFGSDLVGANGVLDRAELGRRAFSDREKTKRLNELVQTAISVKMSVMLHDITREQWDRPIFLEVPLLFETGWNKRGEEVWTVSAPKETRLARVMESRGLSEKDVLVRMSLQLTDSEREARSDVVIDNSGTREELRERVEALIAERLK